MVSLIAFLSVTNIAVGYGLAVYINKNYGCLLVTRTTTRGLATQETVAAPQVVELVDEMPTLPPTTEDSTAEEMVSESVDEQTAEEGESTLETAESDTIDEENVLAGIEAFRSQLAKMNQSVESESAPATVEEHEEELVGTVG